MFHGSLRKKMGFWSRLFLPLLAVSELVLQLGIAISSPRILKKKSASSVVLITKESSDSIKVDDNHKEDFISRLPDDILCSIISKLTMKDAVRTSILSTRWRNIYVLLLKISLNCPCTFKKMPSDQHCNCCPQYQQGLLTFLNRFLQLPRHHKMTSFQLSFCLGREHTGHLKQWMHCLTGIGIEELQLKFSCNALLTNMPANCKKTERISFPFQLLSETSILRYLCLSSCNLEQNFQGPFRSLMSLWLDDVPLVNGEMQSILLSCPKLEFLTLVYCGLPSTLFIGGPEIGLKFLTISGCVGMEEIVVCAGNLTTVEIACRNRIKFSASHVPKLQKIYYSFKGIDLCYIIEEVAKGVPQVESLNICSAISEVLYLPIGMFPFKKAMSKVSYLSFNNLRQLCLNLVFNGVFDVQQLAYLVEACPLLRRFHLVTTCSDIRYPLCRQTLEPVYHNNLKEVVYIGFWGIENEMQLITYLLRSAVSLEQILISQEHRCYRGAGRGKKVEGWALHEEELEKLYQLFKQQASCKTVRLIMR